MKEGCEPQRNARREGELDVENATYIFELLFEEMHHVFLDDDSLLVQVFDDEVVVDAVDVDDDGLDGGIALDQDA